MDPMSTAASPQKALPNFLQASNRFESSVGVISHWHDPSCHPIDDGTIHSFDRQLQPIFATLRHRFDQFCVFFWLSSTRDLGSNASACF
jgi:hypothetical protein